METIVSALSELHWSPYAVGIGIGLLSWLSFLISGKPIATSTTFARAGGMIEEGITGGGVPQRAYYKKIKLCINRQWMPLLAAWLALYWAPGFLRPCFLN